MSTHEAQALPLTLGQQIATARRKAKLSQAELGRRWSEHRNTIGRWERDGGEPSFSKIVDLAQLSGWPLEFFARATPPQAPSPDDGGSINGESESACTRSAQVIMLRPRTLDPVVTSQRKVS